MGFSIRTEIIEAGQVPDEGKELQAVLDKLLPITLEYIEPLIEQGCSNGEAIARIASVTASLAASTILATIHPDVHAQALAALRNIIDRGLEQAGM